MKYDDLKKLKLSPEVWTLIQKGLNHAGFYNGTYLGKPGPKTKAAYKAYINKDLSEPKWMSVARNEIGVKEYSGNADNPDVLKYLKSVDTLSMSAQRNDETAWCSAFVNWCMEEVKVKGTEKANARSWLKWGKKLTIPKVGCVTVLWRGNPDGWQGHVGFFVKETSSYVYLLGGNQGDQVKIQRYPKNRILGYRELA